MYQVVARAAKPNYSFLRIRINHNNFAGISNTYSHFICHPHHTNWNMGAEWLPRTLLQINQYRPQKRKLFALMPSLSMRNLKLFSITQSLMLPGLVGTSKTSSPYHTWLVFLHRKENGQGNKTYRQCNIVGLVTLAYKL